MGRRIVTFRRDSLFRDRGFRARGASVHIPGQSQKIVRWNQKKRRGRKEAFLAQMLKVAGKLNLGQTAVMEKVGRGALRPQYGTAIRGGV